MPIGIQYKAGKSAQLKSAVILAGLNSYGLTKIIENESSRNHTENMILNNKKVIKIKNSITGLDISKISPIITFMSLIQFIKNKKESEVLMMFHLNGVKKG